MTSASQRPEEYERIRMQYLREIDPYCRRLAEIYKKASPIYLYVPSTGELTQLPYDPGTQWEIDLLNRKIEEIGVEFMEDHAMISR